MTALLLIPAILALSWLSRIARRRGFGAYDEKCRERTGHSESWR